MNRRPSARLVAATALGVFGLGGVVIAIGLPATVNVATRIGILMVVAGLAGGLLVLFQVTRATTWATRGTDQRVREARKELAGVRSTIARLERAQPPGGLTADDLAAERREIVRQVDARLLGLFELLAPAHEDNDDQAAQDDRGGRGESSGRGQDGPW